MPAIVTVNVSQQVAPTPSKLQQTGCIVSQGGTNLSAGTIEFLSSPSDLTPFLTGVAPLAGVSWASGIVTLSSASSFGIATGTTGNITVSQCNPTAYNGTWTVTAISSTVVQFSLADNPGPILNLGSWTAGSASELQNQVSTFFGQATSVSAFAGGTASGVSGTGVYILEVGAGIPSAGVTALASYIANPTVQMYAYLLPVEWNAEPTAIALAKAHESTTASLYFWVTCTISNYAAWQAVKSAFVCLQAPTAPSTEVSIAAMFYVALSYNPGPANLASPFEFSYLYGVTPYALSPSQQVTLSAAGVNWVSTGAEGGISNTLVAGGTFMDGNTFNYWYAIDWVVINESLQVSAAVINGSNNPTNPLYYNQNGINTLQRVAQSVVNNGISFGLILSPAVVTAVPFAQYVAEEPGDYASGLYAGLACTFTPQRGFAAITLNLTATNIPV